MKSQSLRLNPWKATALALAWGAFVLSLGVLLALSASGGMP